MPAPAGRGIRSGYSGEVPMRRGKGAIAIAMLAMLGVLAGCWAVPGAGPQRSGHNPFESVITPANVASLAKEWT